MALKNNWKDLVDGESFVEVDPINRMAHAIIANEENILSVQKSSESIQADNKSQEAKINELSKGLTRFENDAVRLDSKINENEKRITNLEKGIPSDLFLTDSSIAYSKNVPQNALPYAEVKNIGGMTYKEGDTLRSAPVTEVESVGVNLLDLDSASFGSCVLDGETVRSNINDFYYSALSFYTKSDWILSMRGKPITFSVKETYGKSISIVILGTRADGSTYQEETSPNRSVTMVVADDFLTVSVLELRINRLNTPYTDTTTVFEELMLYEGSTALPYRPYRHDTLPIPEAVQALDGYGDGVNESVYNYIDFEAKQFVKRVGKIVLDGSADEVIRIGVSGSEYTLFYVNMGGNYSYSYSPAITNYDLSYEIAWDADSAHFYVSIDSVMFAIPNSMATSLETVRAHLASNPLVVYYELATPVVTDISDLLSEDNFIGVEGSGTITMINQYKYNVPSEIAFMLNEV